MLTFCVKNLLLCSILAVDAIELEAELFREILGIRDLHDVWPCFFVCPCGSDDYIDFALRFEQRPYACNHSDTHVTIDQVEFARNSGSSLCPRKAVCVC